MLLNICSSLQVQLKDDSYAFTTRRRKEKINRMPETSKKTKSKSWSFCLVKLLLAVKAWNEWLVSSLFFTSVLFLRSLLALSCAFVSFWLLSFSSHILLFLISSFLFYMPSIISSSASSRLVSSLSQSIISLFLFLLIFHFMLSLPCSLSASSALDLSIYLIFHFFLFITSLLFDIDIVLPHIFSLIFFLSSCVFSS